MLGKFGIDDILKTPGMDNLHVINAGQGLLNPAEILRSPRFKEFLREVREHYDIIIVDTPPVLPVADAFEVASEVDGVILVYEVGRIGRGILKRAKVQLENMNSNVLGVILNNVKPDVAPDFYRYRTDYYYRSDDSDEAPEPPSRWREFVGQPLRIFQNMMRSTPESKGKRTIVPLLLIIGILAIVGLVWQGYPTIKSVFQSRPDQKEFSARERQQQKPIVPATTPRQTESESSDLSPTKESLKTASIETTPHGQILEQKEMKPGHAVVSQPHGKEKIEPARQTAEEPLDGQKEAVAPTPVTEDKATTDKEPGEIEVASAEVSIKDFLEKWRRSWEEGDVQTYIGCYHSSFTARGMDIQAWKNYKQDIFKRTVERDVQINGINIELDGSIATVTFKQRYETRNYKGYGLKTLQLTNYQGNWSILDEYYESLPPGGEPVEVAIERFVENWRQAWEEGDLPAYMDCYDPSFSTEKMDNQAWKSHKQRLFSRSAKRNVQISDMEIQTKGSSAVVTFTQEYQTSNHRDLGTKTLHIHRDDDRWTILKETWQPISGQG
jgi:murein L,D-transpeptidase YafK